MKIEEMIFNNLYNKYNKLLLTKKDVCQELSISTSTLDRRIKNQEAIPEYVKEKGLYLFPITSLCEYILNIKGNNGFAF